MISNLNVATNSRPKSSPTLCCTDQQPGAVTPQRHLREADVLRRLSNSKRSSMGFARENQVRTGPPAGGNRIRTCMGLFLSSVVFVWRRFFVRSGKAVLRPVACDQVRGARGRGQGTETVAKLGGLPLSGACVSQRLRPEYAER